MEVSKSVGTFANGKIQSVLIARKCKVEPVKRLLADPSLSNNVSLSHMSEVYLHLQSSQDELLFLKKALFNKNIVNSSIEVEVEEVILDLETNIKHLEAKMTMYKQVLENMNKSIDTSNIKNHFANDLHLFNSLIKDILLVYEIPNNNNNYGEPIRKILADLGNLQSLKDSQKLKHHQNQCKSMLREIKVYLECFNRFSNIEREKNDTLNVQRSLESLLKLCSILMLHIE